MNRDTYFHPNDDGSLSFLVDTVELAQIRVAMSKHGIAIIGESGAVFNTQTNKTVNTEITVDASIDDIEFALDDLVKFMRPYANASKRVGNA